MRQIRSRHVDEGFTLVELLVVVAIIALLVSILMPTLNQAKELARQAYCLNNNNMIGKGMTMYTAQWGTYPYNYAAFAWSAYYPDGPNAATDPNDQKERWALACISEFMGGQKRVAYLRYKLESQFPGAFKCPSADLAAVYTANGTDRYHACYWTNIAVRLNFGFNKLVVPYTSDPLDITWWGATGGDGRILGACSACGGRTVYIPKPDNEPAPSGVMFSGDTRNTAGSNAWYAFTAGDFKMRAGRGNVYGSLGFDRHQDKIMAGYLDGHAAAYQRQELDKFSHFSGAMDQPSGDFMLRHIKTCVAGTNAQGASTRVHSLPATVVN